MNGWEEEWETLRVKEGTNKWKQTILVTKTEVPCVLTGGSITEIFKLTPVTYGGPAALGVSPP